MVTRSIKQPPQDREVQTAIHLNQTIPSHSAIIHHTMFPEALGSVGIFTREALTMPERAVNLPNQNLKNFKLKAFMMNSFQTSEPA